MFTHECLLRNVGESKMYVVIELTKLGYSPMYMNFENNIGGNNVVCEGQTWHCTDSDNKPYCIDCGENIDLFIAIAALRDDNNHMQWFTDGEKYLINKQNDTDNSIEFHKATVEELFKFYSK